MSLKVPQFMDGQDYWQLFHDMAEFKGFIVLGIYTKNCAWGVDPNSQSEMMNIYN